MLCDEGPVRRLVPCAFRGPCIHPVQESYDYTGKVSADTPEESRSVMLHVGGISGPDPRIPLASSSDNTSAVVFKGNSATAALQEVQSERDAGCNAVEVGLARLEQSNTLLVFHSNAKSFDVSVFYNSLRARIPVRGSSVP